MSGLALALAFIPMAFLMAQSDEMTLEERVATLEEKIDDLQSDLDDALARIDELENTPASNGDDDDDDSDSIEGDGTGYIRMCHNGHTIHVGIAAMRAHLGHGDDFGACGNEFSKILKRLHDKKMDMTDARNGKDGEDGQDGEDGSDGEDGQDGEDGEDGNNS